MSKVDFSTVTEFENKIAEFFGAPFAVATDSATHAIELCLRHQKIDTIWCPRHTYLSVPMLANKLKIKLEWKDEIWENYYQVAGNIFDCAVYWQNGGYVPKTFMCISFQNQKHLKIGRAGVILLDNKEDAITLKKMSYDGRHPEKPWREQNIDTLGFHYYLLPELAKIGLDKLQEAIDTPPRIWSVEDWPDISKMTVFKEKK